MKRVAKIKQLTSKSTFKNAVMLFFSRGINTFAGFASTILYGVVFSKTEISSVTLFEMVVQLVFSAGFAWSSIGLVRFGREEYDHSRRLNRTSAVRTHLFGMLFLVFIFVAVLYRERLMAYLGVQNPLIIPLLIVNSFFWITNEHFHKIFMTVEKHFVNVIHDIGISVFKLLIFLSFYFKLLEVNVITYLFLSTLSLMLFFVINLIFSKKEYVLPVFIKLQKHEYTRFISFIWPQLLGFGGIYIINWIDVWVIREFCSFEELGAYNYMYNMFMKIAVISYLINTLFFPKILSWKKNTQRIKQYLKYIPLTVFASMIVFAIGMNLIFPYIFNLLFSGKFNIAYSSFSLLLFTLPFYYATYTLVPLINSFDRVLELQAVNIIIAVINLVIDLVLISRFGIIGGAVGTLTSYVVKFISCIYIARLIVKQKIETDMAVDVV